MEYRQFSAVDLATDPAFIDWVQCPDATNTAFWEGYVKQNPDQAEEIRMARHFVAGWRLHKPLPTVGSQEAVWANIQAAQNPAPQRSRFQVTRSLGQHFQFGRYAAVFLGLLVMAAGYVWLTGERSQTRYVTGKGEIRTITLPDGSKVTLAANSSVAIVGDWQPEHTRELRLVGEAFFSVKHQKNHQKFIVTTPDNLRVEVLGTTFTVTERATKTQIVLNTGRVALYLPTTARPLVMKPGELVDVPKTGPQPIVRRNVKPEVYSAWTANQFVFDNTSLGEIALLLETEFDVKIRFADDSLKDRRVTLRLPNRDLNLLLTALAEIHDLSIDRQPNRILLSEKPSATP